VIRVLFFILLMSMIATAESSFGGNLVSTSQYTCRIESHYSIRLLILKHCPDNIANVDAQEAIQAANVAQSKGLTIETIGNYHINKEGRTDSIVWDRKFSYSDLDGLRDFISEQMKINSIPGDTFVIYTIGHGSRSGSVMRLGQREGVMRAIAEAAEENDQRTFWWQLSCNAGAHLPPISSLNDKQQELFSMLASSPANELSYFRTQGARMQKVFTALATNSPEIDPNQDNIVTAKEISDFISKTIGEKHGRLVFARSDDEPIFSWLGRLANSIPIVDRNEAQQKYRKDYIPIPQKRK
jgi:hypothetical protein